MMDPRQLLAAAKSREERVKARLPGTAQPGQAVPGQLKQPSSAEGAGGQVLGPLRVHNKLDLKFVFHIDVLSLKEIRHTHSRNLSWKIGCPKPPEHSIFHGPFRCYLCMGWSHNGNPNVWLNFGLVFLGKKDAPSPPDILFSMGSDWESVITCCAIFFTISPRS